VLLHVLNTCLFFLVARRLGWTPLRCWLAAAFFAACQVHQEAVMWYAALPELLLFFFCGCFLLSWNGFVRSGTANQYALAALWFTLALLSKEAAVILVPIAAALAWKHNRNLMTVAPFASMALAYALLIFAAKNDHLHLNDGTFSFQAPVLLVWIKSLTRMLWFSGFLAIAAITVWNRRAWRKVLPAAIWTCVAVLPFCFLLYMPVVPSRHTYLPSAGVGLLVATGLLVTAARFRKRRWVLAATAAALLTCNGAYIVVKKRGQFLERAAATEELLRVARDSEGLIYMTCFPYGRDVAAKALEIKLDQPPSRLVWDALPPPGGIAFCAKDP